MCSSQIAEFEAGTADEFYAWAKRDPWAEHIGPGATIACDFTGKHPTITHTHFGALKLKDAIVDVLRDTAGFRPDVSLEQPSVRVHAHANRSTISVSIDLSGESLHRRGYRGAGGEAPLKENVAAGVLIRAGWPGAWRRAGAEFLDPMCGSGTFVDRGGADRARASRPAWDATTSASRAGVSMMRRLWKRLVAEAPRQGEDVRRL